ncbi:hypothetical protein B0G80_4761 [Paraburkholderia sp. BL6669N2]|nr:hypothetical protein B0G80_4761 [Paraburkholderia sp. BL6669N2]
MANTTNHRVACCALSRLFKIVPSNACHMKFLSDLEATYPAARDTDMDKPGTDGPGAPGSPARDTGAPLLQSENDD